MIMSKLKAKRIEKGWSQQVLGFHCSVSASDISRIETGRMKPYEDQAERIARVLELKAAELQAPASQQEQISA
jgi:ribosome-binding protein aMBF1 (putative translation factor)